MTTAVPNAEIVFGAHEAAVVNAEVRKSAVRKSASGGALPRVCTFIAAAPLFIDLSGSAARCNVARSVVAVSGKLGQYVNQTPQSFDSLALQPAVQPSAFALQGYLVPVQDSGPPDVLWDLNPQRFQAAIGGTPAASAPLRSISTPPQLLPDLSSQRFAIGAPALVPSFAPLRTQFAAPQPLWDPGSLFVPVSTNRQGPTIVSFASGPELRELVQPSNIWPSLPTPPVLITGPTVFPQPQSYSAPDLSINYSVLFTPSTFSPSAPTPPPAFTGGSNAGGGGGGGKFEFSGRKRIRQIERAVEKQFASKPVRQPVVLASTLADALSSPPIPAEDDDLKAISMLLDDEREQVMNYLSVVLKGLPDA